MTLYHGTVSAYLPAIQKMGLKVSPSNVWRVGMEDDPEDELPDNGKAIYLAPMRESAIAYARGKAKYLGLPYMGKFDFQLPTGDLLHLLKLSHNVVKTSPVLLTVTLTPTMAKYLRKDEQDSHALKYLGKNIPPTCITEVAL